MAFGEACSYPGQRVPEAYLPRDYQAPTPESARWQKANARTKPTEAVQNDIIRYQFYHYGKPWILHTPEEQHWDHKSHLMKMIKAFKEDINKSLKEIQENIIK